MDNHPASTLELLEAHLEAAKRGCENANLLVVVNDHHLEIAVMTRYLVLSARRLHQVNGLLGQPTEQDMPHDRFHCIHLEKALAEMKLDHLTLLLDQASLADIHLPDVYYQLIEELSRSCQLLLLHVPLMVEVLRQQLVLLMDLALHNAL